METVSYEISMKIIEFKREWNLEIRKKYDITLDIDLNVWAEVIRSYYNPIYNHFISGEWLDKNT